MLCCIIYLLMFVTVIFIWKSYILLIMCLTIQKMIQYMIRKIGHPLHDMYPGLINMLTTFITAFWNIKYTLSFKKIKYISRVWEEESCCVHKISRDIVFPGHNWWILFRNYNLPQLVQLQLVKGLLGYWHVSLVFKLLK